MISNTSVMSTSGVTLIPMIMSSLSCAAVAMAVSVCSGAGWEWLDQGRVRRDPIGLEIRHHLAAQRFGARDARLDDTLVGVVNGDRRDGDHDSDRGRDQRLADL